MPAFRRPAPEQPVGDAIPFAHDGQYHLFFLSAPSDDSSWLHWRTDDFKTWEQLPVAVAADTDGAAWTGSVIERDGLFHLFYTGALAGSDTPQTVCRATSTDLVTFTRDTTGNPILVPEGDFELGDWRDPFVFHNPEEDEFWMVIAARRNTGPYWRRGCLALATSPDLETWTLDPEPLYEPGNTFCPECPEIFAIGTTWYLVYSRFSENAATVYRTADSPRGPWRTPMNDALDGRRWYAAKSLPVGNDRRMFFGWIADRQDGTDRGAWRWGGDFGLPREVAETVPGRLGVAMPSAALQQFTRSVPSPDALVLGVPGRSEHVFLDVDDDTINDGYVVECRLRAAPDVTEFGLLFRMDDDLVGYAVTFDRGRSTVALTRWPPPASPPWENSMGHGSAPEVDGPRLVERHLPMVGAAIDCRLVVEDSLLEIFVDEVVALSYRVYHRGPHELGWYVSDGELDVASISVRAQASRPED